MALHVFILPSVWTICVSSFLTVLACDEESYKSLPEMNRRAPANRYGMGREISDHALPTGWYSDKGYRMVTDAPAFASCSTYYPIWLQGTIPSPSDGVVTRKACVVFFGNCYSSFDIKIQNCGTFRLYELKRTTMHSAYCFEEEVKPEFEPGPIKVKPTIEYLTKGAFKVPALRFSCSFQHFVENVDSLYQVAWSVNDQAAWTSGKVAKDDYAQTDLTEKILLDKKMKLGINIKCAVVATATENGLSSDSVESDNFFAGVKVAKTKLEVLRGDKATIKLELTVPFGCTEGDVPLQSCNLVLAVIDPSTKYGCLETQITSIDQSVCGTKLTGKRMSYWITGKGEKHWQKEFEITVTTTNNREYTLTRDTYHMNLQTDDGPAVHGIWKGHKLPQITVLVRDDPTWQRKTCYSHVDPHMQTFDKLVYENQNLGTFIMYKHTDYPMEVHMTTGYCSRRSTRITCACGVAVQAGGDIFTLDFCEGKTVIGYPKCNDNILYVYRKDPKRYVITLPFGTSVEVYFFGGWNPDYPNFMNIDISSTVNDINRVKGLCGSLNGNKGDDFTKPDGSKTNDNNDFSNSWKIDRKNSLFNPDLPAPPRWSRFQMFCVCPAAGNVHQVLQSVICSPSDSKTCLRTGNEKKKNVNCPAIGERKRSTHIEIKRRLLKREFEWMDYGTKQESSIQYRGAAQTGFSLDEAKDTCNKKFQTDNKAIFDVKNGLPPNDLQHILGDCARDLVLTNDTTWIDAHQRSWISNLDVELAKDNDFRKTQPNLTTIVKDNLCPNHCSGKGSCVKGECKCDQHFGSDDCSIDMRAGPPVNDVYNGGICDISQEDCCGVVPVYGKDFIDGKTLKCKVQILSNMLTSSKPVSTVTSTAEFESIFEADCNIPCNGDTKQKLKGSYVHEYIFSISNNGQHFGKEHTLYAYNSKCLQHEKVKDKITFRLKPNTCFIDGECYNNDDVNPTSNCLHCKALSSTIKWTYGTLCPEHSTCTSKPQGVQCDCHAGYIKTNGGKTCYKPFNPGTVTVKPKLEFLTNGVFKLPALRFICGVKEFSSDAGDLYQVSWSINGRAVWTSNNVTASDYAQADLTERRLLDMKITLGINIRCGVSVIVQENGKRSKVSWSATFFAGVKIPDTKFSVKRGSEVKVNFELTVPFSCAEGPMPLPSCKLILAVLDPKAKYGCLDTQVTPVDQSVCGTTLVGKPRSYWTTGNEEKTWQRNFDITVTTTNNRQYTLTRDTYHMNLKIDDGPGVHEIWKGYTLPQITVMVTDDNTWKKKSCYSHVDPHMKTFDGRRYENQHLGTFTLYKHTDYPMEVQMTTAYCYKSTFKSHIAKYTCACGVAVQAGGDIFALNVCEGATFIGYMKCNDNILYVHRKSPKRYVITLPFGTTVEVNYYIGGYWWNPAFPFFLNIDISSTINDVKRVKGLCGNLNGNLNDDFIKPDGSTTADNNAFSLSWRIDKQRSIFNPFLPDPPGWNRMHMFCVCPTAGSVHQILQKVVCSPSDSKICLRQPTQQKHDVECPAIRGRKRSTHIEAKRRIEKRDIDWDALYGSKNLQISNRALGGNISHEEAIRLCDRKFENDNKDVYSLKTELPENTLTDILRDCALDLENTQDLAWISAHENSWVSNLDVEIEKDNTFRNEKPKVVEVVVDHSCPDQCSGKGKCVKGKCQCNPHFGSEDCSIDMRKGPPIKDIYNDGVCDLSKEDCCGLFPVYGKDFIQMETLTCKLQIRAIMFGSSKAVHTATTTAKFESLFEVDCEVPCTEKIKQLLADAYVYEYIFSVSNNGQNFGNEHTLHAFKFECIQRQATNGKFKFGLKANTCFIDGDCYNDGDVSPQNHCYHCKPATSAHKWTHAASICPKNSVCRSTGKAFECDCNKGYIKTNGGKTCGVNGNWANWGPWSKCDKTCEGGSTSRHRTCTQPSPQNGGQQCPGVSSENKTCNTQDCPIDQPPTAGPELVAMLKVGTRVVRGRDWQWRNQDGDPPGPGTVILKGTGRYAGWYWVKWDSGNRNCYRMGYQNAYDLYLYSG